MPLDGLNVGIAQELIWELRNLPDSHDWNFRFAYFNDDGKLPECGTAGCALGYMRWRWPEKFEDVMYCNDYARVLGFPSVSGTRIFAHNGEVWNYDEKTPVADVTPEMVADALEAELNKELV